jgi:outer membrane protein assembly factor BamD
MRKKLSPSRFWTNGFLMLVVLGFLFQLAGCGLFKSTASKEMERTPESLLSEGIEAYQRKKYEKAIEAFQKLKDRFPYNQYAIVAELKLADSYFLNKDYALAATAYKEFEKLHPANEVIPYIIFQLGMCYFKEMPTIDRDQSFAAKAIQEFERLIKTYPKSEYTKQAEENLITGKKNLVLHEFYIGEFYFKEKKYAAALGRFEGIIKNFPGVPHPPKMNDYIQFCRNRLNQVQTSRTKTQ